MATFFDDEPERHDKHVRENTPAGSADTPAGQNRRFQFHWPDRKFWWVLAAIAIVVNVSITFSHQEGDELAPTQSALVTCSFLYLFIFAFFTAMGFVLKAPDPEDNSRTVSDKLRANRAAKKTTRHTGLLSVEESRLLDQMEASLVPKKDQFDVIVLKDLWKFWEPDGRSAR